MAQPIIGAKPTGGASADVSSITHQHMFMEF